MSTPASSPKSRIVLLVCAIGLALLAAFLVHVYLRGMSDRLRAEFENQRTEMVQVVVPRYDLPPDSIVDLDDFGVREMAADFVPPDAVMPDDIERAEGQSLKLELPRGRPLQWNYLSSGINPSFSDSIQSDKRALTIAVDELNSINKMIRPNDRIDLFYIADSINPDAAAGGGDNKVVIPLLQNVVVKATGNITRREVEPDSGDMIERSYGTLTLDLSPTETGRVILAQEQGALRAVLKHSSDAQNPSYAITRREDLLGAAGTQQRPGNMVAMYVGGARIQDGVLLPHMVMPGTPETGLGNAAPSANGAGTPFALPKELAQIVPALMAGAKAPQGSD